jgi:3-oxoadipate enol-lactonase
MEGKMKARVNGFEIYYEMEGPEDAPLVTFNHSLATNLSLWQLQLPALLSGYRVLRLDMRGHGGSSAPPAPYSMQMLAADVVGLLDHLGVQRTHYVGISIGGMIGQVLGCMYPERIEKLVLCNTVGRVPREMAPIWDERIQAAKTDGMQALVDETLERWLTREFRINRPEIDGWIRNMVLHTSVTGYEGCCRAIGAFDFLDELSKTGAQTLVMTGEKDENSTVAAAEEIQKRIAGAELFVIPGVMHLSNIEAADLFNTKLAQFLA